MRLRVPVELVRDHCLSENAQFRSATMDQKTRFPAACRVQSGNRTVGLVGLIAVVSLLAFTVYFVVSYLL